MRRILGLAWPLLVAQFVSIGMMVADTLIVGHFSTAHLAAVAVASGIYVTLALALGGVLQALAPIVGHHCGAGRIGAIGADVRQGLWLTLFLAGLGILPLGLFPRELLAPARLEPEVEEIAVSYLRLMAFALPANLGYRAFYAVAAALGHPRPLMYVSCAETLTHALLAWCLVGGHLPGLAPLGAPGAALSQALVNLGSFVCCGVLLARLPCFRPFGIFSRWEKPARSAQKELLRLGVPTGFSYLVEISAFTLTALFIARLGAEAVGGHRITANISALAYMLPLSLAIATATQVAQAAGAGRERLAWAFARAGLVTACVASVVMALFWFQFREAISRLATEDPQVAAVAAALIFYIAIYQIFDAIQTVACFSLRAYKISFLPLLIHMGAFWGLGLGFGYWLAFHAPVPQGVAGFWQAAVAATLLAALLLGGLLLWVVRKRLASR
ncbi:MAG: MATE family efflux transporter [Zoogloeaceae bacterium]|nr:MATE family efflux transporter [Zoogloeaceae bacterium]